mgnify:CR=1 FL=1
MNIFESFFKPKTSTEPEVDKTTEVKQNGVGDDERRANGVDDQMGEFNDIMSRLDEEDDNDNEQAA